MSEARAPASRAKTPNDRKVPHLAHSPLKHRCSLAERQLSSPRRSDDFRGVAAMISLRAHAAQKSNSQIGLFPAISCTLHQCPVLRNSDMKVHAASDHLEAGLSPGRSELKAGHSAQRPLIKRLNTLQDTAQTILRSQNYLTGCNLRSQSFYIWRGDLHGYAFIRRSTHVL